MKPRITITHRHTGRYYVGLDSTAFAYLLAVVRHEEKLNRSAELHSKPADGLVRLRAAVNRYVAKIKSAA